MQYSTILRAVAVAFVASLAAPADVTSGTDAQPSPAVAGVSVAHEPRSLPGTGDRLRETRSRAQVMAMQQALKDKGFEPGRIDGVVGPKTAAALLEYQKSVTPSMPAQMDRDATTMTP